MVNTLLYSLKRHIKSNNNLEISNNCIHEDKYFILFTSISGMFMIHLECSRSMHKSCNLIQDINMSVYNFCNKLHTYIVHKKTKKIILNVDIFVANLKLHYKKVIISHRG